MEKKYLYNLLIVGLCLVLGACNGYLDEIPQNKQKLSTTDDYDQLLNNAYLTKVVLPYIDVLTDDMDYIAADRDPGYANSSDTYLGAHLWDNSIETTMPNGDEAFENFYNSIFNTNVVIENIDHAVGDVLDETVVRQTRNHIKGEAYALRAFRYFYLVNMYGAPYENADQAKNAMGVPINKEISILDKIYVRERLQTVYDLIEEDLKSALDNFNKGEVKNTIFRPNKDVARLFLSRAYLFQKKYDKVITVCDDMIKETVKMIVPLEEMKTYTEYSSGVPLYNKNSHSLLYTCWARDAMSGFNSGYWYGKYAISDDLKKQYGVNDVRPKVFFDYYGVKPIKYTDYGGCYGMCYRIEEIYFNRAEAYIESGDYELGMKDVNRIYSQRIDDVNVSLSASDVENARKLFRQEKRRELCFETIRWFDIRRWGLAVEHDYKDINDPSMYQTYVLEANSPNYILPLPLDIQRRNDKIEKPERVEAKLKN